MSENYIFSKQEIDLLENESLIRKKNKLLREIENQLIILGKESTEAFPELTAISPPLKVSKGEKQAGLPFLVLDYPRVFTKDHVFAVRTLVWWGKFISFTLHLKGEFLKKSLTTILQGLEKSALKKLLISYEGNEWQHDLEKDSFILIDHFDENRLYEAPFLKIAYRLPIASLNQLSEFHKKYVEELLSFTPYGSD